MNICVNLAEPENFEIPKKENQSPSLPIFFISELFTLEYLFKSILGPRDREVFLFYRTVHLKKK